MKAKQALYGIATLLMVLVLSVALPVHGQDEWPEGCQLPDLDEAMSAANDAQATGDAIAYLESLDNIADATREAYETVWLQWLDLETNL